MRISDWSSDVCSSDLILPMPLRRQVGDVAVPIEQVEGRIVVAEQIIADDIIPDQVAPTQRVEGRGHIAADEKTLRPKLLEQRPIASASEHLQVARHFKNNPPG